MDEVRADPVELSGLASATLAVAVSLTSGWRAGATRLAAGPQAYGGHEGLRAATSSAAAAADLAVRRVLEAFTADADRLWATAFAYEEADERAQWRLGGRP
jgi:hypothetical protein